jgi:hypothetical protein
MERRKFTREFKHTSSTFRPGNKMRTFIGARHRLHWGA